MGAWLDDCVTRKLSVAVIEVGVGANTPIVTSIPAVAFASAVATAGGQASYLRVNPDPRMNAIQGNTPAREVAFYLWQDSWQSLKPLVQDALELRNSRKTAVKSHAARQAKQQQTVAPT